MTRFACALAFLFVACGGDSTTRPQPVDAAVIFDSAPLVADAVALSDSRPADAPPQPDGDPPRFDAAAPPPPDAASPPDAAVAPADARLIDAPPPADAAPPADAPVTADAAPPDARPIDARPPDAMPEPDAGPIVAGAHPSIYLDDPTVRARLVAALAAPSPAAKRFRDMVDAHIAGADVYAFSPAFPALLGELTGQAKYCAHAIALEEEIVVAEEARITAKLAPEVAGDHYLDVGGEIGDLMMTYDWCFGALTDSQRSRWRNFAAQAVWNVWHNAQATWGGTAHPWDGWSVDNPSNNYYYSFLTATLTFGLAAEKEHPDAPGWLTYFRQDKLANQLFPTFNQDLEGGGSREGTGYGASMRRLFELYYIWGASQGEAIDDDTPHTRASLFHFLHAWLPTLDRIAPTGDHSRDSSASFFDYHRAYLLVLGALMVGEEPLAGVAMAQLAASPLPRMGNGFMFVTDFLYEHAQTAFTPQPASVLLPAYHAIGTGQLYARSSWEEDATWIHFIAGPYTESHAHHDQGAFLYFKNDWLAYDQNINSHSGIRLDEEVHNLVRVVGGDGMTVEQRTFADPSELLALEVTDAYVYMAADITPIYDGDPDVTRVQRELVFVKPDTLVVFDRVDTPAGAARVWQLNTPVQPVLSGTTARLGSLRVDRVLPAGNYQVVDWEMTDDDMNAGYRLDSLDPENGGRFLHVLSQDAKVATVVAASEGSKLGCTVTLKDGSSFTVKLEDDSPGGTLQLGVAPAITLTQGVDVLPLRADGTR